MKICFSNTMFRYASNWCNAVGATHTDGIIPINANSLSIMELGDLGAQLTPAPFNIGQWNSLRAEYNLSSFLLSIPAEVKSIDPAVSKLLVLM